MLAEVVFVTRFLGLVTGPQVVTLHAGASAKRIEIRRDGTTIASLNEPPWRTTIDFGRDLKPHELTAIAVDGTETEVGRDTQIINLARPVAEVSLLLDGSGGRRTVRIEATHLLGEKAESLTLTLDGKVIRHSAPVDAVPLPALRSRAIHSLGAEVTFADRAIARKEIVFGGIYSEEVPAELTPVAVRKLPGRAKGGAPCFSVDGAPLTATDIEDTLATVSFVIVGTGGQGRERIGVATSADAPFSLHRTDFTIVSPVAKAVEGRVDLRTDTFPAVDMGETLSTRRLATRVTMPKGDLRFTDAVAVSAVGALGSGRRRAVVLIIGGKYSDDRSVLSPPVVRRYLERIGVPLFVWSTDGPRADLEQSWGRIENVSSTVLLLDATRRLGHALDSQRIAWVPVAPLAALRVQRHGDCVYEPLARTD